MSYQEIATILRDCLGLEYPAIALAIVDDKPADISAIARRAPSSCSFWRAAEATLFFASAEDHGGCAVGAHVMGFPLSEATQRELGGAIGLMAEVAYLNPEEVPHIPQLRKKGAGAVYGPLSDFPLPADAVIVWVTPAQAMLLGEALGTTAWNGGVAAMPTLFGRPACGAVARSVNAQAASLSLGCTGMRTFTQLSPGLAFMVLPGSALETLVASLAQVLASNRKMQAHYEARQHACA